MASTTPQKKHPKRRDAGPGIVLARPFGIPVYISPYWFVVAGVFILIYARDLASTFHGPTRFVVAVAFVVLLYLSVLVHELSLVVMKDGKTAEAGIVGNEGFTGTPAAVGLNRTTLQAVIQITGEGFRVEVGTLQNTLKSAPHLRLMLNRYAVVQGMQVAQTAACNRLHNVEQRFARWLLMTQDRVDSGSLPITHDFLATMLGTDRPTVSLAAGVLQKKEIIEYTRGAVKIVNRKKLEDSACECYEVIREYDDELGLKLARK